jgi:hypothetical protein
LATKSKSKTLEDAITSISDVSADSQPKQKRKRRTKKEMEAALAEEESSGRFDPPIAVPPSEPQDVPSRGAMFDEPDDEPQADLGSKKKSVHPITVNGASAYDAGRALSALRYDAMADLMRGLSDGLTVQMEDDMGMGRVKLPGVMDIVIRYYSMTTRHLHQALVLSRKKMDMESTTDLKIGE